jgi:adenylate cyclase
VVSIATALAFTFIDGLFTYRVLRFFPIGFSLLVKTLFYMVWTVVVMFYLMERSYLFLQAASIDSFLAAFPTFTAEEVRFLVFFYILCYFNNFFAEAIKKIGRGNFQHWFFGLLNKPTEENRIFMFIDLKDSTSIAEKLGHKKFSYLVQDVFNDMAIVDNYNGQIYNYMGDGAIITWNIKGGLKHNNFLRSFYAFVRVVQKRKRYYNRKYGLQPQFKAGVHVGKVMVLQVGQIKRDISYNGDTMNTAARIESKCNELKQALLISSDLYNQVEDTEMYQFKNVGDIALRGKKKAVEIYGVKLKTKK